jgi:transcriptional regulator of acetoin/glycerol metabolism
MASYAKQVTAARRVIVGEALARHGGNVSAMARDLGLQRTYAHRLLRKFGLHGAGRRQSKWRHDARAGRGTR